MKVDSDLRAAIRAAEKTQPAPLYGYELRVKAAQEFLHKKPNVAKKVKSYFEEIEAISKDLDYVLRDFEKYLSKYGMYKASSTISVRESDAAVALFLKAGGGTIEKGRTKRWTTDAVIAQLAAADPKEEEAILKKYNIVWK